jgi:thiol oxidase
MLCLLADPSMDARQVLLYVRGYVKHFFGCRECSQNFMRGAVHIEERVHNDDDAVMFLWRSHNKANWNLRGDASEDPQHAKVQFPSAAQCPACHVTAKNGSDLWNEPEVLRFLRTMYSRKSIVMDSQLLVASDSPYGHRTLGFTEILKSLARQHDRFDGMMSITALDISLCFVFYIICALVLIALYVRFCRSRKVAAVVNLFQSFSA